MPPWTETALARGPALLACALGVAGSSATLVWMALHPLVARRRAAGARRALGAPWAGALSDAPRGAPITLRGSLSSGTFTRAPEGERVSVSGPLRVLVWSDARSRSLDPHAEVLLRGVLQATTEDDSEGRGERPRWALGGCDEGRGEVLAVARSQRVEEAPSWARLALAVALCVGALVGGVTVAGVVSLATLGATRREYAGVGEDQVRWRLGWGPGARRKLAVAALSPWLRRTVAARLREDSRVTTTPWPPRDPEASRRMLSLVRQHGDCSAEAELWLRQGRFETAYAVGARCPGEQGRRRAAEAMLALGRFEAALAVLPSRPLGDADRFEALVAALASPSRASPREAEPDPRSAAARDNLLGLADDEASLELYTLLHPTPVEGERPLVARLEGMVVSLKVALSSSQQLREIDPRFGPRWVRLTQSRLARVCGFAVRDALHDLDVLAGRGEPWPAGRSWASMEAVLAGRDRARPARAPSWTWRYTVGVLPEDLEHPWRHPGIHSLQADPMVGALVDYWRTGEWNPPHEAPSAFTGALARRVVEAASTGRGEAVHEALGPPTPDAVWLLSAVSYRLETGRETLGPWLRASLGEARPSRWSPREWLRHLALVRTAALRLGLSELAEETQRVLDATFRRLPPSMLSLER